MDKKLLVLIDGNNTFLRYYFAGVTNPKTILQQTKQSIANSIKEHSKKEELEISYKLFFDTPTAKEVKKVYWPDYKANRSPLPEEIANILNQCINEKSIENCLVYKDDYKEADTLIANTIKESKEVFDYFLIYSTDKDFLQLISDKVSQLAKKDLITFKELIKRIGINDLHFNPSLLIKCLTGDNSDNIPGIPRIGEKTAIKYIASCCKLPENLYTPEGQAYWTKAKLEEKLYQENPIHLAIFKRNERLVKL